MLDQFNLRVRFPHEIDRIFSNRFNYKTGTIYYIESLEYEERIKLCYDLISEDLKVELVNFVKISLPILKAEIRSNKRNLKNKNEQTDFAKDYILAFVKLKYKFFSKWVEQKSIELQNNREITEGKGNEVINAHPNIFENGGFEIFLKWIDASNDELDKKLSFIFQKLKQENKLRTTTFKKLSEWSFENKYLNETTYNKLLISGSFLSPSKILTKSRLELYNSIIEI
jgi:hypothetical protein